MRMNWKLTAILFFMGGALGCAPRDTIQSKPPVQPVEQAKPAPSKIRYADAHVHIIDFLQNGAFDNSDKHFKGVGDRGRIKKGKAVRYLAVPYRQQCKTTPWICNTLLNDLRTRS